VSGQGLVYNFESAQYGSYKVGLTLVATTQQRANSKLVHCTFLPGPPSSQLLLLLNTLQVGSLHPHAASICLWHFILLSLSLRRMRWSSH
jgi:hypothetical protein